MFYLIEWRVFWGGRTGRFLLCVMLFMFCISSRAGIFYVSDSLDTTNVTSLRGAIIAANLAGGDNTIVLTNEVYALTIQGADETASFTGDLDVTNGSLAIIGLGASNVTITATNLGDRVLQVFPRAEVSLFNLIITGGASFGDADFDPFFPTNSLDGESGGGIYNAGTLNMSDCIVTSNSSGNGSIAGIEAAFGGLGGSGAGVFNSGLLTMSGCTISDNTNGLPSQTGLPGSDGGGIYNGGEMAMDNCTVAENSAGVGSSGGFDINFGSAGGNGGGIYNAGLLTLNNCKISSNSSGLGGNGTSFEGICCDGAFFGNPGKGGDGGGIYNRGTLILNFCNLSENISADGIDGQGNELAALGANGSPGGNGGGIYNSSTLTMTSCTLNDNQCGKGGNAGSGGSSAAGGAGGGGAGLYSSGSLVLISCTVSGNICGSGGNGGTGYGPGVNSGTVGGLPGIGGEGGNGGTGGGIYSSGQISIVACTIAGNSGGFGANGGLGVASPSLFGLVGTNGIGGIGGSGGTGGIFLASSAIVGAVRDSLLALDIAGGGGAGGPGQATNGTFIQATSGDVGSSDVAGEFLSEGHNLIGVGNGSGGFTNRINGDLVGSALSPLNAMVGPLTDNGGQTETCNLLPGSPAIDAGDDGVLGDPFDLTIDQRGEPRKSGTHVDIGAVEYDGIINGVVQPAILESGQNSGRGFRLSFNAATQLGYSVFASSYMRTWSLAGAATEISRGLFLFQDAAATNYPQRFYRVRRP